MEQNDEMHDDTATTDEHAIADGEGHDWADELAVELRSIGETVSELVNEINPGDPDAAYRYIGVMVGERTGGSWVQLSEMFETLVELKDLSQHKDAIKEDGA